MTTRHTPGPWTAKQHPYGAKPWLIEAEGAHYVAASITQDADAALIAAAPDMISALHRCIAALAANDAPNCEAAKEARAAIALATGAAQ